MPSMWMDMGGQAMSDSKKPKLSEIRARAGNPFPSNTGQMLLVDIPHLLDLVKRMGKTIDHSVHSLHFKHIGNFWNCERLGCKEARALLNEIAE